MSEWRLTSTNNWQEWPETLAIKAVARAVRRAPASQQRELATSINEQLARAGVRVRIFPQAGKWDVVLYADAQQEGR